MQKFLVDHSEFVLLLSDLQRNQGRLTCLRWQLTSDRAGSARWCPTGPNASWLQFLAIEQSVFYTSCCMNAFRSKNALTCNQAIRHGQFADYSSNQLPHPWLRLSWSDFFMQMWTLFVSSAMDILSEANRWCYYVHFMILCYVRISDCLFFWVSQLQSVDALQLWKSGVIRKWTAKKSFFSKVRQPSTMCFLVNTGCIQSTFMKEEQKMSNWIWITTTGHQTRRNATSWTFGFPLFVCLSVPLCATLLKRTKRHPWPREVIQLVVDVARLETFTSLWQHP